MGNWKITSTLESTGSVAINNGTIIVNGDNAKGLAKDVCAGLKRVQESKRVKNLERRLKASESMFQVLCNHLGVDETNRIIKKHNLKIKLQAEMDKKLESI